MFEEAQKDCRGSAKRGHGHHRLLEVDLHGTYCSVLPCCTTTSPACTCTAGLDHTYAGRRGEVCLQCEQIASSGSLVVRVLSLAENEIFVIMAAHGMIDWLIRTTIFGFDRQYVVKG